MNPPPDSQTIPDLIVAQAEYFGDREAVVAGEVRLTYQELLDRSRQAAKAFLALGVEPDSPLGVRPPAPVLWEDADTAEREIGASSYVDGIV